MQLPQPMQFPNPKKILLLIEKYFSRKYRYEDMKVKKRYPESAMNWEYDFTFYFPQKDLAPIEEFPENPKLPAYLLLHNSLKFRMDVVEVKYLYGGSVELYLWIDLNPIDVCVEGSLLNPLDASWEGIINTLIELEERERVHRLAEEYGIEIKQ